MNRLTPLLMAGCIGLAACTCASAASSPTPASAAKYAQLMHAVVARYHLPGMALGVIAHGKVVFTDVEGKLPSGQAMNAHTVFQLGSISKAFTVTLLARLAQQGKLRWNNTVTQYLPQFRMHDPWVTDHMRVADLLSHDSGLHAFAGDIMLWPHPSHFTPADVVHALRYFKPAYGFRGGYAYDNVLYVTAGQVAAAAGGAPYAKLMRRDVFQPLGLTRCEVGTWNRATVGNVARRHIWRHGRFRAVAVPSTVRHATTMDAAGGISCSLDDMLAWARNWLAPTPQQLQWLDAEQRQSEWAPRNAVPASHWPAWRTAWNHIWIYNVARGWFVTNPDGEISVWHTGVLNGIRAALVLLPNQKSGFVVLINAASSAALKVMSEVVLKQLTSSASAYTVAWYADAVAHAPKPARLPVPDTSAGSRATVAELKGKLGTWRDPWFGKVRICPAGRGVAFASEMSPLITGQIMHLGKRYFVKFKHGVQPPAWLDFPVTSAGVLHLTPINPNYRASSSLPALAFTHTASCS